MAVQAITDETFESLLMDTELPIFLDFYADWCGPCKALAPVVDKLSEKYVGQMVFGKIDVERNPGVAQMFRVQSIPTLAFIKDRRVVDVVTGALPAAELEERIQRLTGPPRAASGPQMWDPKKAKLSLEGGIAQAVDLRGAAEFGRCRIPGAIHAPAEALAEHLDALGAIGRRVVFYARTSEGAREAAEQASAAGLSAAWIEGGLLAWETEMYPVERPA
jgi:thioredoxin 1